MKTTDFKTTYALKTWIQAIRIFSLTASIVPVLVGAALVPFFNQQGRWMYFPIVIICSVCFQAGTNLISDYFDYINQVDKDYTFGSSRVIVDGLLTARQILIGSMLIFGVAIMLGFILVAAWGVWMLVLGVVGFLGGVFYTAKPIAYKYIGLGNFLVFLLMGPLMVIGSFFALTGTCNIEVFVVSLPIGFLVSAILYANNLRDIKHDTEAGIKTLENTLGYDKAVIGYYLLLIAAYLSVFVMVVSNLLPIWSLLVFLTVPLAVKNIVSVNHSKVNEPETIALLDVQTAKLHLAFGVLLIISIITGVMI